MNTNVNIPDIQEKESSPSIYGKIIEDIASHKDLGRRSSLAIGMECGYPQEKVQEAIKMGQLIGGCPGQERYYYFIWKKNGQDYIVCLDTESWSASSLKKIDDLREYSFIRLQKNKIAMANEEKIRWEDFITGESAEITWKLEPGQTPPSNIEDMRIIEDGIVLLDKEYFITKVWFDGRQRQVKLQNEDTYDIEKSMLEMNHKIYVLTDLIIWEYDKDLRVKRAFYESLEKEERVLAMENNHERCYFYTFDAVEEKCYKYSKDGRIDQDKLLTKIYLDLEGYIEIEMQEIMTTKDYRLLDKHIFAKDWQYELPHFSGIKLNFDKGLAALYSQNIFVGVQEIDLQNDTLIKLDLDNSEKAAAIPVTILG